MIIGGAGMNTEFFRQQFPASAASVGFDDSLFDPKRAAT